MIESEVGHNKYGKVNCKLYHEQIQKAKWPSMNKIE